MVIGVCTLDLAIHESGSLKSKRQVLKSLKDRLKGRFNIAVAELADQDLWQRATIGVVCIGTDRRQINGLLDSVVDFVEEIVSVELIDYQIEIL